MNTSTLLPTIFITLGLACSTDSSKLNNQTNLGTSSDFLTLWSSKTIKVCIVDPSLQPPFLEDIRQHVALEYQKVGFSFESWQPCSKQELASADSDRKSPLLKLSFENTVPQLGGATVVGVYYGKGTTVTIKANPENHASKFCRSNPKTCVKAWVTHEFGHTLGLTHSHNHPQLFKKIGQSFPPPKLNTSDEWSGINYFGDFSEDSMMSYLAGESAIKLSKSDIRTIKALYDQPSVLIKGSGAQDNGGLATQLKLEFRGPKIWQDGSSPTKIPQPTHYRYKLLDYAKNSCSALTLRDFSPPRTIDTVLEVDLIASGFGLGTTVQICALGEIYGAQVDANAVALRQDPAAATHIFVVVGVNKRDGFDFSGQGFSDNCSGAVVKFPKSKGSDAALILTNRHCLSDLTEDSAIRDQPYNGFSLTLLASDGSPTDKILSSKRLVYASLKGTDMALMESADTISDLQSKGFRVLTMANRKVKEGQQVTVMPGLFSQGFRCPIAAEVPLLKEATHTTEDVLRYGLGCQLFPGTSGSPLMDARTGEVLGLAFTGNDQGLECTKNNPCEVRGDEVRYQKGWGYALQLAKVPIWGDAPRQ